MFTFQARPDRVPNTLSFFLLTDKETNEFNILNKSDMYKVKSDRAFISVPQYVAYDV